MIDTDRAITQPVKRWQRHSRHTATHPTDNVYQKCFFVVGRKWRKIFIDTLKKTFLRDLQNVFICCMPLRFQFQTLVTRWPRHFKCEKRGHIWKSRFCANLFEINFVWKEVLRSPETQRKFGLIAELCCVFIGWVLLDFLTGQLSCWWTKNELNHKH